MMVAVWVSLGLFWIYVILTVRNLSEIVWAGLFFLWILLVLHYGISYQRWRKEDNLRRKERLDERFGIEEEDNGGT